MGGIDLGEELLEVGPGPGLTTDILLEGDAAAIPFRDESFSGAVAFTMLHHVSSAAMQDRLLAEVYRVLRPGGAFVGSDSLWSRMFEIFHWFDTMVVVDPSTFADRLKAAGFDEVSIEVREGAFRFAARRPAVIICFCS